MIRQLLRCLLPTTLICPLRILKSWACGYRMEDNKITEVNSDFSENLRITSASRFQPFCITNTLQFSKPAHLVITRKTVACRDCSNGHTRNLPLLLVSLLPLQLSPLVKPLASFILVSGI